MQRTAGLRPQVVLELRTSSGAADPLYAYAEAGATPAFTAATVLPLSVGVPAAATYSLVATQLTNLPTGLGAYLYDTQTGQALRLAVGQGYSFQVTAQQAQALLLRRFTLQFSPAAPLAATPAELAAQVQVYPNPAHDLATVAVPGLAKASTVQAELLNGLGQVVRHQSAALPTAGTQLTLPTAGLAAGVYVLRLKTGETTLVKRLTIE